MRRSNASLTSAAPLTVLFLSINIVLYMLTAMRSGNVLTMNTGVLSQFGASQRELLWDGEWVRLVAPMFLHGGFIHILFNMQFLYRSGTDAEIYFGSSNYATIYLVSGVCGICMSQILNGVLSIGASTSLCGIMGAHLGVRIFSAPLLRHAWRSREVRAVALNLAFILGIGILGVLPIDNWGHFGGMVGGFVTGSGFELWRRHRATGPLCIVASLLFAAALVCAARWTVFNPTYHIYAGARAIEEENDAAKGAAEFAEAKKWAGVWDPISFLGAPGQTEVNNVIAAHGRKGWSVHRARKFPGMLLMYAFYSTGAQINFPAELDED